MIKTLPSTKPIHSKIFSVLKPLIEHLLMVFALLSDQYSFEPGVWTAIALGNQIEY